MKVLLSKHLLDKVKLAEEDQALIHNLNHFISSIQEKDSNIVNKAKLIETNIYVYKMEDIRLFFSLHQDDKSKDVVVLLDFVRWRGGSVQSLSPRV